MWHTIKTAGQDVVGFNQWPNPFKNMLQQVDVLACENTFVARIKMATALFGAAYWSACVPSPRELERRAVTGTEKCGIALEACIGGEMEIPWISNAGTEIIAFTIRPVITGFFFMWLADTAQSFLQAWHTLHVQQYMCDTDRYETVLSSGSGDLFTSGAGAIPNYEILWTHNIATRAPDPPSSRQRMSIWRPTRSARLQLSASLARTC